MERELLIDPRDVSPSRLILPLRGEVRIDDAAPRRQRFRGELELTLERQLSASNSEVAVHRLGLFTIDTPLEARSGEISIASTKGAGVVLPSPDAAWRLEIELSAAVTYRQIAPPGEVAAGQDFTVPPSERFTGTATVELVSTAAPGPGVEAHSATLTLERRTEVKGGALRSLRFESGAELLDRAAWFLPLSVRSRKTLPLRPVRFPLGREGTTGHSWQDQLDNARSVWNGCGIDFIDLGFKDLDDQALALEDSATQVFLAHREEGAIEVFLVASRDLADQTDAAGAAFAAVLLVEDEDQDPFVLAHELGHVLGACHPDGQGCDQAVLGSELTLWRPTAPPDGSVLQPADPLIAKVPAADCVRAYDFPQPLLQVS